MSDSAPLSFAQRASNLASNQAMPLQRAKPAQAAAPKKAAPSATAAITSPTASSASTNGQPALKSPTKPAASSSPNQAAAVAPAGAAAASSAPSSATAPGTGPVRVVKAPKEGFALVTAVSSGDSLQVIGNTAAGQKTPEKTIIVSGIQAPKFAKGKNQKDEPFAWESREYLRKRVIGKQSQYHSSQQRNGS